MQIATPIWNLMEKIDDLDECATALARSGRQQSKIDTASQAVSDALDALFIAPKWVAMDINTFHGRFNMYGPFYTETEAAEFADAKDFEGVCVTQLLDTK